MSVLSLANQMQDPPQGEPIKSQVASLLHVELDQNGKLYFLTYSGNIKAIFVARCIECHNSGAFPQADWTNYAIIFAKKDLIYNRVIGMRWPDMPYQNMTNMTRNERYLMGEWILSGAGE